MTLFVHLLAGWLVCLVIISYMEGKYNYHAPIRALLPLSSDPIRQVTILVKCVSPP